MPRFVDPRHLALVLFLLPAALFLGGRLPYFFLFTWLFLLGLAVLWGTYARQALKGSIRLLETEITAGQRTSLMVHIQRTRFMLPSQIRLHAQTNSILRLSNDPGIHEGRAVELPATGHARWQETTPAMRRGIYPVGDALLVCSDPLGLTVAERTIAGNDKLTVLPRIYPLQRIPWALMPHLTHPEGQSRRIVGEEDPSDFRGIRPFVPGDVSRRIHWKQSARMHSWQLKEFSVLNSSSSILFLDLGMPELRLHQAETATDLLCDLAASLLVRAGSNRAEMGLVIGAETPHRFAAASAHPERVQHALRLMAGVQPITGQTDANPLQTMALSLKHQERVVWLTARSLEQASKLAMAVRPGLLQATVRARISTSATPSSSSRPHESTNRCPVYEIHNVAELERRAADDVHV